MFNLANNLLYIIQYLNNITIIARKFLNMDFKMGFFYILDRKKALNMRGSCKCNYILCVHVNKL